MFAFRYHGNYVGPGWSAGKYQPSVARSKVPAVDEFDATAKRHDSAYASKNDLKKADYRFYKDNIGRGLKRSIAALAVGTQGFLRKPRVSRFGFKRGDKEKSLFSQKKKTMAPVTRRSGLNTPRITPRKRAGSNSSNASYVPVKRGRGYTIMRRRSDPPPPRPNSKKARRKIARGGRSGSYVRKAKNGKGLLDSFQKRGMVVIREGGSVFSGTAALPYQTMSVHQATFGRDQIIADVSLALTKAIVMRCFNMNVESPDTQILPLSARNYELKLAYKPNPFAATAYLNIGIVSADTVATLAAKFSSQWQILQQTSPKFSFLWIAVTANIVATAPNVGWETIGRFDLTIATVDLYAKSEIKLQSRTVSTTGNDEADDVDAVPLSGRIYEGPGNFFQILENYYFPTPAFTSNYKVEGHLDTAVGPLKEPAPLSAYKRMKKTSKLSMEPGEVKTSVLSSRKRFTLNQLSYAIGQGDISTNAMYIGKQRFMLLEKKLQSIATTDVNALKVAFEVQLTTGTAVTLKKMSYSTPAVYLTTL